MAIIYTDHYDITGDVDCYYKGLSYDASSSFDDGISEIIAPYDVKNMKEFTPSFLSGFYADTADVAADVYRMDAEAIAVDETYKHIKKTAHLGSVSIDSYQGNMERRLGTKVVSEDRALFPVWFLSYRNKDRVAYAIINGQTGKVVADLPVSLVKYFVGSALLAIPIFILLNLMFTIRPKVTLVVASFIALITIIMYVSELKKIYIKDKKLDDRGRMYAGLGLEENMSSMDKLKEDQKLADSIADAVEEGRNRKDKKKCLYKEKREISWTMKIAIIAVIFSGVVPVLYTLQFAAILYGGSTVSLGMGFPICVSCFAAGVILTVTNHKIFKNVSGKNISGNIGSLAAMLIAAVVLWFNPVSDIYYYAAVIVELIAIIYTVTDLIRYYNMLATRKLPQFDNYRGGDDNV